MNPEVFTEWLRRQGHQVIRTENSYWYDQGPRVYQAFPYHWLIQPYEIELKDMLKENHAIGLRYSTPLEAEHGCISYHAVYEGPIYDLENLGKWARKNTRRGLRNCHIEQITFDFLAEAGWLLQLDTLDRQGRKLRLGKEQWSARCMSAKDLPGFNAWGAWVGNELAASVITFQMDKCGYMLSQQCLRKYLSKYVNNALSFVVTKNLINNKDITSILYGLHSLDAPPSVDEFKFRMGYWAKPVRQRVVFHPYLTQLFNRVLYSALLLTLRLIPGSSSLSKAEGMLRFYLQGKRPLDQQIWPEGIVSQKPAMNATII